MRTRGRLHFAGDRAALADETVWTAWLRALRATPWAVYAKPPFGGPERVLKYLGRYTHRVAIANHRLVSIDDGVVRFRWKDYAHRNQMKVMALPAAGGYVTSAVCAGYPAYAAYPPDVDAGARLGQNTWLSCVHGQSANR